MVAGNVAEKQALFGRMPDWTLGEKKARSRTLEANFGADDRGKTRIANLDAHFFFLSPGRPATNQSGGAISSITTQTPSRGNWVTSQMASVTRAAISFFR